MRYLFLPFFVALVLVERFFHDETLPRQRFWYLQFLLIFASDIFLIGSGNILLKRAGINFHVFNLGEGFNLPLGILLVLLVDTFLSYWWHRARHQVPLFWRVFHLLHHSPQRFEVAVTFYKHPMEKLSTSLLGALIAHNLFNLGSLHIYISALVMSVLDMISHCNFKTPQQIGYFIQRPEMHRLHHDWKILNFNYSILPVWDLIFGTYANPPSVKTRYGLGQQNFKGFLRTLLFLK